MKKYLKLLERVEGTLRFHNSSTKESVALIRRAKKQGITVTFEDCSHYFTCTKEDLGAEGNTPLSTERDLATIKEVLVDETFDVIASDYAPIPRRTGC